MKALSIRQPWAHAILHFGKRVENREWQPGGGNEAQARRLIGQTIAIHAGKGCTRDEYEGASDFMRDAYAAQPWDGSTMLPALGNPSLTRGAIVGRATLADVTYTTLDGHRWDGREDVCELCGGTVRYAVSDPSPRCPKSDPWAIPGCLGLVLADVVALPEPVPFKGALGFFEVPDELCR